MECGTFISKSLLASSKSPKVLSSLGNGLAIETNDDLSKVLVAMLDVEVDLENHQSLTMDF